jgi:lipopolysaccharide export system protein LptC
VLTHRRQRLLVVILSLLGVMAWWFAQRAQQADRLPQPSQGRRPDYVVDRLSAVVMNIHGQPERQLSADQLRHYPDDDSSELEQPQLLLYEQQSPPWHIRAEHGWVSSRGKNFILSGEVQARRAGGARSAAIRFQTSELRIRPEDGYAETDRFVEIEQDNNRVSATEGLHFWYSEPLRARLFGRVRARVGGDL